jgi:hypothetical protein
MIVMVVPSEAANDIGISSFDAGKSRSRRNIHRDWQHYRGGGDVMREGREQTHCRHDYGQRASQRLTGKVSQSRRRSCPTAR